MDWFLTKIVSVSVDQDAGFSIGHDGLDWGSAFLLFLLLAGLIIWSYGRFAPDTRPALRRFLILLRLASAAILVLLLVKPVIHITLTEPIRQSLLVLVDTSTSMSYQDNREKRDDLARAAIATGALSPEGGLGQSLPGDSAVSLITITRWDMLKQLAANTRLDLWSKVFEKADLSFYTFGRDPSPWADYSRSPQRENFTAAEATALFESRQPDQQATAIGESLRETLEFTRGRPVGAVLVITDGANNSGLPPMEAAHLARDLGIPLHIYGVGVSNPPDIIMQEIETPRVTFVNERATVTVTILSQNLPSVTVPVTLSVDGAKVDEQVISLEPGRETQVTMGFIPAEAGNRSLTASIPLQAGESNPDNNALTTDLRVVDEQLKVLYIDQVPRWDFRYLLAFLEQDRRLKVSAFLTHGDPDLDQAEDSPFLPSLPKTRAELFENQVVILGDVNPEDLGTEFMQWIREWIGQTSGGLIFLAGPSHNPHQYLNTPLEPLLPIIPDLTGTEQERTARQAEPISLRLTPTGERTSMLQVAPSVSENIKIWESFPGVRWLARVERARPGAQVLLVAPLAGREMPVIVSQRYGGGETVFIGHAETYRWRSRVGGDLYTAIWNQIMQSLAMQRIEAASDLVQLSTERKDYFTGEAVIISGRVFNADYTPLTAPTILGQAAVTPFESTPPPAPVQIRLESSSEEPGNYRGQFIARVPGLYRFTTPQDPDAVLEFFIRDPDLERLDVSLNETLLRRMTEAAGGKFLREESLHTLPDLLSESTTTVSSFRRLEIYHNPWWAVALLFFLFMEWSLRRLNYLK
jgi:hypothetical protein